MAQSIWAREGGEIVQHNGWHEQSRYPDDQCHELVYVKEYAHFKKKLEKVNSRHHQTMSTVEGIPDSLEVIAYAAAKEKNRYWPTIVEMFKFKEAPIYGCQFHPKIFGAC